MTEDPKKLIEILQEMTEACFALDHEWRFTFVNARCQTLLHHDLQEMIGSTIWEVFPQVIGTSWEADYRRVMEERVPVNFEVHSPVAERWLDVRLFPIGEGLAAFLLDIDAHKQAEAVIRQSEERLQAVTDNLTEGLVISDSEGQLLHWNRAGLEMCGYRTLEEGLQRLPDFTPVFELIGLHGRILPLEEWPLSRVLRGESIRNMEVQVRRLDRPLLRVLSYSGSLIRDSRGEQLAFLAMNDVTARRQAEAALSESEERFRTMANSMPQLAWMAHADGHIFWYNQRWYEYTGTTEEEVEGWAWQSVHHPEVLPIVLRDWKEAVEGGEPFAMEFPLRGADGNFRTFLTRVEPMRNGQGKVVQWFGTNTDVEQLKRVEESLRAAKTELHELNAELEQRVVERTAQLESANKELEAFSYSVSHDLRAPLRAIDGFSQALSEDYGGQLPEEGQFYIRTIREGAQRMGMLIDDLLTFSRLSRLPLRRQIVDAERQVREVLAEVQATQDVGALQVRIGELPEYEGDAALIKQVWMNLLSNAVKYSSKREAPMVEIGVQREQSRNVYYVRDNGTGFDMRYAGKLFGVFQRLHRQEEFEGTGVGLAIVQRIVHRHGGRVWAEAKPNEGATFYFVLSGEIEL